MYRSDACCVCSVRQELLAQCAYLGALLGKWRGYGAVTTALFQTALALIKDAALQFPVSTCVIEMQLCSHLYHSNDAKAAVQLARALVARHAPAPPPNILNAAKTLRKICEKGRLHRAK